jgi:hypothetical protein
MERAVTVEGTILTADTKRPIAGAEIYVQYGETRQGNGAFSDSTGKYRAKVLPGPVHTQVTFLPKNIAANYTQIGSPWNEPTAVPDSVNPCELPPIALAPTEIVRGKLIDKEGKPVLKARVTGNQSNRRYGFGRSDDEGKFSLQLPKGMQPDKYEVWIEGMRLPYPVEIESKSPLILRVLVTPE